ncbi:MAG: M20/M25/M40 family metallo-hydrolase, partial [Pseudomonadota bacterium]
ETVDPVMIASQLVTSLQSLVSRSTSPLDNSVLSVTTLEAGSTFNVIPGTATIGGTVRTFKADTRDMIEAGIERMANQLCAAYGAKAHIDYWRGYPPTVNHEAETDFVADVASEVVGEEGVDADIGSFMGAEDFAYMLEERPGSYFFVGQGGGPSDAMLHHPQYQFNDEILPIGSSMFARLVERSLARS